MKPLKAAERAIDSKRFKKLAAQWEKRLEREGLGNIEKRDGDGWRMKQSAQNVYRGADPIEIQTRLEFFLEASNHCQRAKFKCATEQRIMELYCEGISIQDMKRKFKIRRDRKTIGLIIRKYLILFGLHGKYFQGD